MSFRGTSALQRLDETCSYWFRWTAVLADVFASFAESNTGDST